MNGEKIVVTGGAGFIGRHLVQRLLSMKDDVSLTVLDNFSVGMKENLAAIGMNGRKFDVVRGDVRDGKVLDKVLAGADTVYHMAAVVGVDRVIAMPEETWDVEVNGTRTLLEKCECFGVKRFFLASSSECYGKYDLSRLPMKESDEVAPNTNYGKAKLECEKMCAEYGSRGGMNCVGVRYFNVYGKLQSFNGYVIPNMIWQALNGEPVKVHGHGRQLRDFMYIDDAVCATIKLAESKVEGVYNVGAGKPVSIMDVAKMIMYLTASKSQVMHVPIRRPTDIESKSGDNTKIRQAIGWMPVHDIQSGLVKTIDDYKRCLDECSCNMRASG